MSAAYNRKQRRAAAAAAASAAPEEESTFDPSSIPLARAPEYTDEATTTTTTKKKPKGKTLYELAAEREAELFPSSSKSTSSALPRSRETEFVNILPSGELSHARPASSGTKSSPTTESTSQRSSPEAGNPRVTKLNARGPDAEEEEGEEEEEEGDETLVPLADTILTSLPLCTLHFTLAYLAAHQFAQEIEFGKLFWDSAMIAFPSLTFMIHLAHGHIISFEMFDRLLWGRGKNTRNITPGSKITFSSLLRLIFPPAPHTFFYLPLAFYLGFRLIVITNDSGYYAVMKKAPSVGTLWVWCVLEMSPAASVLALVLPICYGILWKGYSLL